MNRKRWVIEQRDSWYAVIDRAIPGPDHWARALCQDRGDARIHLRAAQREGQAVTRCYPNRELGFASALTRPRTCTIRIRSPRPRLRTCVMATLVTRTTRVRPIRFHTRPLQRDASNKEIT